MHKSRGKKSPSASDLLKRHLRKQHQVPKERTSQAAPASRYIEVPPITDKPRPALTQFEYDLLLAAYRMSRKNPSSSVFVEIGQWVFASVVPSERYVQAKRQSAFELGFDLNFIDGLTQSLRQRPPWAPITTRPLGVKAYQLRMVGMKWKEIGDKLGDCGKYNDKQRSVACVNRIKQQFKLFKRVLAKYGLVPSN
jgi:hypothetical protein